MIEREFIPYEQALALKELGFDEPCFGYYEPNKEFNYINWETFKDFPYLAKNSEWQDLYGAPTFSQAFRWFREKYNLFGCIDLQVCTPTHWYIRIDNIIENDYIYHSEDEGLEFNTYEEAELACLKKLIEIVKQ